MASGYEEQLARHLFQQGRLEDAEAAFRLAIAKRPRAARLYLALALCIDSSTRPDEALAIFRQAAELDPMLADAHNGIGICESNLTRAESAFRKAIVLEPQSAEFHANLAFCLLHQKRPKDAEPCLRQAVALEPENLGLLCDWGELLLELRRPRDAESVLRRTFARLGARGTLLDKRGWWLYEERRYEQAEARFRSMKVVGSADEAWLYFVLARALRLQNRSADAIDALRIAIAMAPRVPDFHDELGQLLEAFRKPDAAGAAYARARALAE